MIRPSPAITTMGGSCDGSSPGLTCSSSGVCGVSAGCTVGSPIRRFTGHRVLAGGAGAIWALTNTAGVAATCADFPLLSGAVELGRPGAVGRRDLAILLPFWRPLIARCVVARAWTWVAQRPESDCRALAARCVRSVATYFPHRRSAAEFGASTPTDRHAAEPDLHPFC